MTTVRWKYWNEVSLGYAFILSAAFPSLHYLVLSWLSFSVIFCLTFFCVDTPNCPTSHHTWRSSIFVRHTHAQMSTCCERICQKAASKQEKCDLHTTQPNPAPPDTHHPSSSILCRSLTPHSFLTPIWCDDVIVFIFLNDSIPYYSQVLLRVTAVSNCDD